MAFYESPRFPDYIAADAEGGPFFLTDVLELGSGYESRNIAWTLPRHRYVVTLLNRPQFEIDDIKAHFLSVRGRGHGFRFRDWADYQVLSTVGILGAGVGAGVPAYQLNKRYASGAQTTDRKIAKPIATGLSVLRNASPVTVGSGAGQIAIDTTTGIVTFVADQQRSVSSHTVGASHQFTLASAFSPNLAVGGRIYVTGVTGTAASVLNSIGHAVTNVATNVITVSTTTTGLTATGGTAFFYPQPTESLAWSGEFDVPVRYDTDSMQTRTTRGGPVISNRLGTWDNITLVELRT